MKNEHFALIVGGILLVFIVFVIILGIIIWQLGISSSSEQTTTPVTVVTKTQYTTTQPTTTSKTFMRTTSYLPETTTSALLQATTSSTIPETTTSLTTTTRKVTTTVRESWHKAGSFQGTNGKSTDLVSIDGEKWRFTWNCIEVTTYGTGYGGINIFVYPDGEDASYVGTPVFMGKCGKSETSYIYEGDGTYYFEVQVANVISWSIDVESYH